MTTPTHDSDRDERLEQILVEYLEAREGGRPIDHRAWLARYPEFAEELREFFAAQDQLDGLAAPLGNDSTGRVGPRDATLIFPGDAGSAKPKRSISQSNLGVVRYFGDYELLEEVARGGMGVVYRARQAGLNRIVALKMILAGRLAGEEDVTRFRAEAEAAASLDHPGIVPVFEVGEHEGQHYFSMAFIEGESLADRLHEGPLPPQDAALLAKQIADAVAYAHSRGVIHRDLKPANILLTSGSRDESRSSHAFSSRLATPDSLLPLPKITDFGLAKRLAGDRGITATGQILGTPSYMPPEQASGRVDCVSETADVYSLGALLYAMLTGRPPFQADNPIDTIVQVMEQDPAAPRQLNPKVPRDLETICLKCLEKVPSRRYPTAQELADDLGRLLKDEPIRARPLGAGEKAWRWFKKQGKSVAVAASATAATLAVALLGAAIWYGYSQWRLGDLSLSTDRPPLVAEILDEEGNRAVPTRTLPTSEPVSLPAGDYRMHVRGAGRRGQTYHVSVPRGQEVDFEVNLEDQTLIPTLEIDRSFDVVPVDGKAALMVFDNDGVIRKEPTKGKDVWSVNLASPEETLRKAAPGVRWPWTHPQGGDSYDGHGRFDLRPQFVKSRRDQVEKEWKNGARSAPATVLDLNVDGAEDLILAAHHQAWLLAIDGKSGEMLWIAARGKDVLSEPPANVPYYRRDHVHSAVVGLPEIGGDLDGDGTPDVIATFLEGAASGGNQQGMSAATRWVEAVSGKTGETIWRYDLPEAGFQLPPNVQAPYAFRLFASGSGYSSGGGGAYSMGRELIRNKSNRQQFERSGEYYYAPDPARLVSLAGESGEPETQVLVVAGSHLVVLDSKTGKPRFPPHGTGCRPVRSAVLADGDGDGAHEALFLEHVKAPGFGFGGDTTVRLIAWSLDPLQEKWRQELGAGYWISPFPKIPRPTWPVTADLDGDGADEILAPVDPNPRQNISFMSQPLSIGWLRVMEGSSGRERWRKKLRTMDQQVDHFTVGPDLDGDGHREVFAATLLYQKTELYVDCLSGADGRTLWWTGQRLDPRRRQTPEYWITGLSWWNTGRDGWPQLIVSLRPDQYVEGPTPEIYVFSAGTGSLTASSENLDEFHLGDADGDGREELFAYRPWGIRDRGGNLDVLDGAPPEQWRRLGRTEWVQVDDLDSDGVADLAQMDWSENPLVAISGRTGEKLWRAKSPVTMANMKPRPLGPRGDFNGDGAPEILVAPASHTSHGHPWRPYHLFSGRDGRLLWSADIEILSSAVGLLLADVCDLDADGAPELILANQMDLGWDMNRSSRSSSDGNLWLLALSGRSGAVRWRQALSGTAADGTLTLTEPRGYFQPDTLRAAFGDLDGDGVRDVFLPAEVPGEPSEAELRAVCGRTGKTLWSERPGPSPWLLAETLTGMAPQIGDVDGDGRNEAIALGFFNGSQQGVSQGEFVRLTVLDGGTGEERWRWQAPRYRSFSGGHLDPIEMLRRPTPHLLRAAGRRESLICVNLWGQMDAIERDPRGDSGELPSHVSCIAVLNHTGELISNVPLRGTGDFAVWPLDADGDGGDELAVLSRPEGLRLIRPGAENDVLWQTDADRGSHEEIWGVALRGDGGPPTIIVKEYERVFGVDAGDGSMLWSATPPKARRGRGLVSVEALPLVASAARRPAERLAAETAQAATEPPVIAYSYGDVTLVRRALPPGGAAPPPLPTYLASTPPPDPRYLRPLPWTAELELPEKNQVGDYARWAVWAGILSLVLVVLPGAYLGSLVRNRNWSLRTLFTAPVLVGAAIVALSVPVPMSEHYGWWQKWSLAIAAVPAVLFPLFIGKWAIQRKWSRLLVWVAMAGLLSAGTATLAIIADQATSQDSAAYLWDGWWLVGLMGAYMTGWLLLPAAAFERTIRWRWGRRPSTGRRGAGSRETPAPQGKIVTAD